MKPKHLIIVILILSLSIKCTEDFLDTKNLYDKSIENYYRTPEDIEEALAGAYSALSNGEGWTDPMVVAELMSDDRLGGGGPADFRLQSVDAFEMYEPDNFQTLYTRHYEGILRVNSLIKYFGRAEYDHEDDRNQALGEAHFLRAFFYFRLSQFFGPTTLKLDPAPADLPRATPEEMYGQIALDLRTAIEIMPSTHFYDIPVERDGHVTKWAAQALMARVFLFYTGYYERTELPVADGASIEKQQVITWIDDCIANSGYDLLSDFRNNWVYSRVNMNYPYAVENELDFMDGESMNREVLFAIKYNIFSGWDPPELCPYYSNQHVLYMGLRDQYYVPFGWGWGFGPVNPQLWDSFEEGDIRREGSILNVNPGETEADEGIVLDEFKWNANTWAQMQETGLWEKKYIPVYDSNAAGEIVSIYAIDFPSESTMMLWNNQDDILIRFADVLLMAAELGSPHAQ